MDPNRPPRWPVVVMLGLALAAAVALGIAGALGEENTARLALGVLALMAVELRRPPPSAAAIVGALLAGELGGMLPSLLEGS